MDTVGDAHDIRLLEGISADGLHAHLTGNHDHGHGVHVRVRNGRDHVCGTRAGSHDAHAHLASGQCVAFGGVAGGLLVAHKHEAELRVVFDLVVDGRIAPPGMPKTSSTPRSSSERISAWAPVIFSPSTMVCLSGAVLIFGTPLNACKGVGKAMIPLTS